MKKVKSILLAALLIIASIVVASCSKTNDNQADLLREHAVSLANERGVAVASADNLEQKGTIANESFPQGIISSEIINEDSDRPFLVVADSDKNEPAIVKLRIFSCVDGEVKELGSQSFRYNDYAPDTGTVYKVNSYIHNNDDKTYIVFEEYASQGAAANLDVWQTIYSVKDNELIKEKELGYELMAGIATRWPQFFVDGEVLEGYADANMSADDVDALAAATEKNKEYSEKAMAQFTEIRNSYGLDAPDNNVDLDFENVGDVSIAQVTVDCNSNEYVIKSGGIIVGDASSGGEDTEKGTEADAEESATTSVFAEYAKLLEENADAIKGYSWQNGNSEYGARPLRPVAFCDINGDEIPELFMMKKTIDASASSVDAAELFIYTFKDNAIKEVAYDLSAGTRYSHDRVIDEYVSAGGRYLIYKGKGNTLNMYILSGGTSLVYHVYSFAVDKDCTLSLKQVVENYYEMDNPGKVDIYYKDGKEVSNQDGISAIKSAFTDFDKPIIGSQYEDEDISSIYIYGISFRNKECEILCKKIK